MLRHNKKQAGHDTPAGSDVAVKPKGDVRLPPKGRAPYGYRLGEHTDHTAVEPDPLTAPVVRRIFEEYVNGRGLQVIAEQLTADGVLCPSAYDPRRNPNHTGSAWSKVAVRAIITNDRYAVQHPLGIEHPHCGRCLATRHAAALVPAEVYRRTRDILTRRGEPVRAGQWRSEGTGRYALRGLLRCQLCQRLMQGTWNNRAAYYRCRFPREYTRANHIDHPANVYAREDRLVTPLHEWICRSLPARLSEWMCRQPPAARMRREVRAGTLRSLIAYAGRNPAGAVDLYGALNVRLVYEPHQNLLTVSSEALPGALIRDRIRL